VKFAGEISVNPVKRYPRQKHFLSGIAKVELVLAASFARGFETGPVIKAGLSECAG
jgi:hypothetical protein